MEEELRCHLSSLQSLGSHKDDLSKSILSSDDALFYWLITTADFEIEDSEVLEELLTKIIKLYVTIRCYAFATVLMEKFKMNHKSAQNLYVQLYKKKVAKHNSRMLHVL